MFASDVQFAVKVAVPVPVPTPFAVKVVPTLLFAALSAVKLVVPGVTILYWTPLMKDPAGTGVVVFN